MSTEVRSAALLAAAEAGQVPVLVAAAATDSPGDAIMALDDSELTRFWSATSPMVDAAIEVAKLTPLYRIDGAFKAVRTYSLNAPDDSWGAKLDVEAFVEKGEDICFALKKHPNISTMHQIIPPSTQGSNVERRTIIVTDFVDEVCSQRP